MFSSQLIISLRLIEPPSWSQQCHKNAVVNHSNASLSNTCRDLRFLCAPGKACNSQPVSFTSWIVKRIGCKMLLRLYVIWLGTESVVISVWHRSSLLFIGLFMFNGIFYQLWIKHIRQMTRGQNHSDHIKPIPLVRHKSHTIQYLCACVQSCFYAHICLCASVIV